MSFDLTNKNIKDTFQNLLQKTGSNNQLFDLVGNPVQDLTIQGTFHAQSYIVSQSTTIATSGSTQFGDTLDDIHTFIGKLSGSNNILTIEGNIRIYLSSPNTNDSIIQTGAGSNSPGLSIYSRQEPITFYQGLAANTQLFITASGGAGFVGINTQTPTSALTVVGDISASGASTGSFHYLMVSSSITASSIDVDSGTIRMGGEPFTKANIQSLKQGKSLKPLGIGRVNPDMIAHDGNFDGDIFKTKLVQMTNSSSVIDTFNTGSFRSAKYVLQVISASNYQVSEMLVLHHNSTASNTEYAQLNSGINLINFTTDVNNSNVRLNAAGSFISCSVRYDRTIIPL